MKLRNHIHLLYVLFAAFFMASARAGEVTLIQSEQFIYSTIYNVDSHDGKFHYPCGVIAPIESGSNYSVWSAPVFDGAIAPISYPVAGGATKVHFNASNGYKNYRITSNLAGSVTSDNINDIITNTALDCNPVHTSALSASDSDYNWAQWLYGTFRDVPNNKVYAVMYHEYYGGGYYNGSGNSGWLSALGLAVSSDSGATFQKIHDPPDHIFVRDSDTWPNKQGYGLFGGIFKSPLDQMYYIGAHGTNGTALVRASSLGSTTNWSAWDGSAFNLATLPLSQEAIRDIGINPFYIGFSDYFKKYIAVTIGSSDNYQSGNNLIVYNLSDDLVHWGLPRMIMYNPACGSDHVCGNDAVGENGSYPSIMDPLYLSQTQDSTEASNGITGAHPWVTYIQNVNDGTYRQRLAVQKISFDQVPVNRMDNFSVRGVVPTIRDRNPVLGFIIQGTEPKLFVFRGMGPSLPPLQPAYDYAWIENPRISLYRGDGTLLASNSGWPYNDQQTLTDTGLQPGSDNESAIVYLLYPGTYTVVMDDPLFFGYCLECATPVGLIEAYDLSSTAEAKVAEISIRGYSQGGDGTLTMGLISRGGQKAVVRGTGASTLGPAGFEGVIPDPYVYVYNSAGSVIASNDNWNTPPYGTEIQSYGLAPGNSLESATIFSTQTPAFSPTAPNTVFSNYTVRLEGYGYGLLELYNVNPN